jgi:hypothetical protein
MRAAQRSLAAFEPLIDWARFQRRNLNQEVQLSTAAFAVFACGDVDQAIVWLLRLDCITKTKGTLRQRVPPLAVQLILPGLTDGNYAVCLWDTAVGQATGHLLVQSAGGQLVLDLPEVRADLALAVVRAN